MAKAFGYSPGQQDAWSKQIDRWGSVGARSTSTDIPEQVVEFANELQTFPRHLGIHSGGMVICDRPVIEVCPVEWARMPNRTVLQWDKDDCAAVGLVKFDLLGLGMLSALHYALDLIETRRSTWATMPLDDPEVYDMLCRADSVGVFQVESRAQMATLPRLQAPQVLRPGGRGGADPARPDPGRLGAPVHPAQERAGGAVTYPHPLLENALEQDPGVPLFQEQLMQLAIDVAGFDAGRGRPAAPGDGLQAVRRADGRARATGSTRAWRQRHHRRARRRPVSSSSPRSPTTASRRATR